MPFHCTAVNWGVLGSSVRNGKWEPCGRNAEWSEPSAAGLRHSAAEHLIGAVHAPFGTQLVLESGSGKAFLVSFSGFPMSFHGTI